MMKRLIFLMLVLSLHLTQSRIIDFERDLKAVPGKSDRDTERANRRKLNAGLESLEMGDTLFIQNKTYHVMGGVYAENLFNVTLQIEGTLEWSQHTSYWPKNEDGKVQPCLYFDRCSRLSITAKGVKGPAPSEDRLLAENHWPVDKEAALLHYSGANAFSHGVELPRPYRAGVDIKGTLNGNGQNWWGPGGYLWYQENRPRLLVIERCNDVLVENIVLYKSPYWTFWAPSTFGLEIRYSDIFAKRTDTATEHSSYEMTAFNTDGFDVAGNNVWIHDCNIWCQDDTIAVKKNSKNMIFERIRASGVGITIGSLSSQFVDNIVFRNIYMDRTYKGIYMKFRAQSHGNKAGMVSNVLVENVYMDKPTQWPIWIGPAQQADEINICAAHPCSICWPMVPTATCNPGYGRYENVTLRNISIDKPTYNAGVIMGHPDTKIMNLVFDNVHINKPGTYPFGIKKQYTCSQTQGVATGNTYPVPSCLEDRTNKRVDSSSSLDKSDAAATDGLYERLLSVLTGVARARADARASLFVDQAPRDAGTDTGAYYGNNSGEAHIRAPPEGSFDEWVLQQYRLYQLQQSNEHDINVNVDIL